MPKRVAIVVFAFLAVGFMIIFWYMKPQFTSSSAHLSAGLIEHLDSLGRMALQSRDIPVAALLVYDDKIIGQGFNTVKRDNNAGGHAEINAISDGMKNVGMDQFSKLNRDSLILITTLEPCHMCRGALVGYNIKNVEFLKSKQLLYEMKESLRNILFRWSLRQTEPSSLQDSLFLLHPDYQP